MRNMVHVNVRIPSEHFDKLNDIAEYSWSGPDYFTRSDIIRRAIWELVEREWPQIPEEEVQAMRKDRESDSRAS